MVFFLSTWWAIMHHYYFSFRCFNYCDSCQLDWIERHMENLSSTLLGECMKVLPETIGLWVSKLRGKIRLECRRHILLILEGEFHVHESLILLEQ
jgi:hypothetical protein